MMRHELDTPACATGGEVPAAVRLASDMRFPEGPAFDGDGGLWWVDLLAGCLWCRSADARTICVEVGGRPNGIAIDHRDRIWFCDGGLNAIRLHDPLLGTTTTVCDAVSGHSLDKPNDLAFDPAGNLVFTCPGDSRTEPTGYVCCLTPDSEATVIADELYFPNGLAFVPGGLGLLIAETRRHRVWLGDWDATGRTWNSPRVLATTGGTIGPDGMAVSAEGHIFVAVHGSDRIEIKDGAGHSIRDLVIPDANPTNCAFDPSGRLGLVVTDAGAGAVWSLPTLGPGLPLFRSSAPPPSRPSFAEAKT